jgi:anti-sigma regulatory factor (Ser/Thr protein kinase)
MAYIRRMYMRHALFVIADVGVTMRASNQPVHPGRIEAKEASLMDCPSIAATEASNYGPRAAADGVVVRMAHREVRFPRRSSLLLGALPSAVPCARLHTRQVLWEWGLSEVAEVAELLLSELVTNAVQATRANFNHMPVNVRLSANRDRLLIEVWDGNVQPPVLHKPENDFPTLDAESGRGLFLVETLSERWGWYPTRNPEGKVTWCELGRGDRRS